MPPGGGHPGGPGAPPSQSEEWASESVALSWRAITRDPGGVLLPLALAALAIFFVGFILNLGAKALFAPQIEHFVQDLFSIEKSEDAQDVAAAFLGVFVSFLLTFIEAFIISGATHFCLRVARGARPSLDEAFAGAPFFLPMLGAKMLFGLAVGVGVVFCIIPGLFLSMALMLYAPVLIDRRTGPVEALRTSWELFQTTPSNFVFLWLFLLGVSLLGLFACCIGFVVVSLPMIWLASTVAYLKATRQSIELF
jgi:uncharacterized membrane protein